MDEGEQMWTFKGVIDHQGPLKPTDPKYKGSSWNVLVEWDDGSKTWEPLYMIRKDDPAGFAQYAKEHDLLDLPGWKGLKRLAKHAKNL